MSSLNLHDTIVALATPPGEGALGIIRLSGGEAFRVADAVWKGASLSSAASHTLHYGHIVGSTNSESEIRNSEFIDEAVASIFRNPKSYTGEDIVEFSCHGSPYILQRVVEACVAAGARPAQPGEFTLRAFLAGKLDLTQAEAVADLIASGSEAAHRAAMHQLRGGFSAELKSLREELIGFAALIELELDFSEEDVEFADRAQLRDLLGRIRSTTTRLIDSFHLGNVVKEGVAVAIVGRPNAGKSTLLNTLLGEERAIVSDIPGTTRDTIEEVITLEGVRFRFIDTAGIRNETDDAIEAQGIRRSRQKADAAGLVLYVIDLSDPDWQAEQFEAYDWLRAMDKPFLLVHNKYDLFEPSPYPDTGDPHEDDLIAIEQGAEMPRERLVIDAKSGYGIEVLRARIVKSTVGSKWQEEGTLVTNARHHSALLRMREEIEAVQHGLHSGLSGDLLSHHVRQALYHIGEITGEVQHDRDILGTIFGKFCIGK